MSDLGCALYVYTPSHLYVIPAKHDMMDRPMGLKDKGVVEDHVKLGRKCRALPIFFFCVMVKE